MPLTESRYFLPRLESLFILSFTQWSIEEDHQMRRPSCPFQLFLGLAFGATLLLASPLSAARLLQVYIEQDGKLVAHTYYDDNGRADAATIWRYLATPPIMVDEDITGIEPDHPTLEANLYR